MQGEIEPMQSENETNLRRHEKLRNSKFHFGWKGPLLTISDQLMLSAIYNGSHY